MDRTTTLCRQPDSPLRLFGWFTPEAILEAEDRAHPWYTLPLRLLAFGAACLLIVLLILGGTVLVVYLFMSEPAAGLQRAIWNHFLIILGWVPGMLFASWVAARFARRDERRARLMHYANPFEMTLGREGVEVVDRWHHHHSLPWTAFSGYRRCKRVILLRRAERDYYWPVPVDVLSEETCMRAQSIVAFYLEDLDAHCPPHAQETEYPLVS